MQCAKAGQLTLDGCSMHILWFRAHLLQGQVAALHEEVNQVRRAGRGRAASQMGLPALGTATACMQMPVNARR